MNVINCSWDTFDQNIIINLLEPQYFISLLIYQKAIESCSGFHFVRPFIQLINSFVISRNLSMILSANIANKWGW